MMNLFTVHRLAGLQKASAITFFGVCWILVVCKLFENRISCLDWLDEPWRKSALEESCLNSSNYDKTSEAREIDVYNMNNDQLGYHLFLLAIGFTFLKLLWNIWRPTSLISLNNLQVALKESSFTCARTGIYVLLCFLYLIGEFNAFQHLLGGQFAGFAATWFKNVYDGNTTFAYEVVCEIRNESLKIPLYRAFYHATTCYLEMNDDFEIVYLVLWFWFVLSALINSLCLLQYLLLTFSSTLRFIRLSQLLKSLDDQIILVLAEDVDVFFKIENCAGKIQKLNTINYATFSPANNSPYEVITTWSPSSGENQH